MTWWRIDDSAPDHPKFLALEDLGPARYVAAVALWFRGGCYVAAQRTDGAIPRGMLRRLTSIPRRSRACSDLVSVGLWSETAAGWEVNGWRDRNPTRAQLDAKTAEKTERQRRWRERRSSRVDASTPKRVDAAPIPSHPIPSHPMLISSEEPAPKAPARPSVGKQVSELEGRLGVQLCREARVGVGLSRKNGRIADSVWLRTLQALDSHGVPAATEALRRFSERYADGDKAEGYLVAIARSLARGGRVGGPAQTRAAIGAFDDVAEDAIDQLAAQMRADDQRKAAQ